MSIAQTYRLDQLAEQVMQSKGLEPNFSEAAKEQLEKIEKPAVPPQGIQDLRSLLWCSIDNDDSLDLDQLTYAETKPDGTTTIWVAVADVDALVPQGSPIDQHAQNNTTSVYTPAKIFPMLPEKLSTNLTSLNENEDRLAMVVKFTLDAQGEIGEPSIFAANVHNYAKLTYSAVGAWLEERGAIPDKVNVTQGLEKALRCQHESAQSLKRKRHAKGALTLESPEASVKVVNGKEILIQSPEHNFAHQLIEEFMIAANSVMANRLRDAKVVSLRRVVRIPKNWDRIVEIARELGETLPFNPDSKALEQFLIKRKEQDPDTFKDLSLAVIKLLGRGEYVVENVGGEPIGHFGLAESEYMHSTAPNRRFPDLISQRQCKAALASKESPYKATELLALATHCTQQEDAATKVQRHMDKSAAALLLSDSIGKTFKGIITGAADKGTWVRIFDPPIEGKVVRKNCVLKVGQKVTMKLVSVDIPNGYIDFACVS